MLLKKLQHHDSINFTPYITKGPRGQGSLSFSSDLVREVQARGSGEAARNEGGSRRRKERASPVSRLESSAWSFACLSRVARRTKKKKRLLVV